MRHRYALRWGLIAIVVFLMGPTWPRDDTGTPAGQCSFIGSTGVPTLCSTTDPLPTGPGTISTTDPTGWGKAWFQSTIGNLVATAAVFVSDQTVLAFDSSGGSPRTWVSTNAGRTFALQDTSPNLSFVQMNAAIRTPSGAYLVASNLSPGIQQSGIAQSASGFQFARVTPLPAPCGPANGLDCNAQSLAVQGTTVLATIDRGAIGIVCRSTNSGASFSSCTDFAGVGNTGGRLGVTSPTTSTWLVAMSDGTVGRSTDDGGTFTNVLSMGGTAGHVECLDATRCLATNATGTIWRSTNAGATWATIITVTPNPIFRGFADFGNGVVDAMGSGAPASVFRSTDFGASWSFQTTLPNSPGSGGYGTLETLNGRGIGGGDFGSDTVIYSPVVGAGETIIAGQSGNRWDIDPNGRGEVLAVLTDSTQTNIATVSVGTRLATFNISAHTNGQKTCSEPAANTAATITVTGVAGQQTYVLSYIAFYTTAPAAAQTLTVVSGAANVWLDIVNGANTPTRFSFDQGLAATAGNTVTITLPAGGAGVVGKLCAVASQVIP